MAEKQPFVSSSLNVLFHSVINFVRHKFNISPKSDE